MNNDGGNALDDLNDRKAWMRFTGTELRLRFPDGTTNLPSGRNGAIVGADTLALGALD